MDNETDENPLPFIAPCKIIGVAAPWRWLRKGVGDMFQAPLVSLGYGLIMACLIMLETIMAWKYGSVWIMLSLLCGFVFIAPLVCIGIYAISAQVERNQPVSFTRMF